MNTYITSEETNACCHNFYHEMMSEHPITSGLSLRCWTLNTPHRVTLRQIPTGKQPLRCAAVCVRADAHLIGLENIPTSVSHRAGFRPASGYLHCIVPYGVTHTWSFWSAWSGFELMSMCKDWMNRAEDWSGLNFNTESAMSYYSSFQCVVITVAAGPN